MHPANYLATYLITGVSTLAQLGIACFMWRNGSRKRFPRFFEYSLFGAVQNLSLMSLLAGGTYAQYFYTYYATSLISAILSFLVIQEAFLAALQPLEGLQDLGRMAFRWAAVFMLIVSSVVGVNTHGRMLRGIPSAITSIESSVRLMQVGLLVLLFLASRRLGLSIKSRTFGIAFGMGTLAALNLLCFSVLSSSGTKHLLLINQLRLGFFVSIALTWLGYFALPAAQAQAQMYPIASPLMRWNEVAMALGHSAGRVVYTNTSSAEPFLPQVERMVDRIFETEMKKG